jgi:hypothetical protein
MSTVPRPYLFRFVNTIAIENLYPVPRDNINLHAGQDNERDADDQLSNKSVDIRYPR